MKYVVPLVVSIRSLGVWVLLLILGVGLGACGRYAPHPIHTKVTREFYYQTLQQTPADNDDAYYLYYYPHQQDNPTQGGGIPTPRTSRPTAANANPTRHPLASAPLANPPRVSSRTASRSVPLPPPAIVMIPPQDNDSSYAMPAYSARRGGSSAVVLVPAPGATSEMPFPQDNDELYLPPSGGYGQ